MPAWAVAVPQPTAACNGRSSGGKCSGSKNTSNEGRKEGAENERSSVSTEEVQPVEVAEEVVRGKCGASSLIVGEANPELNSMVEKSVLSMVNPGDEISAVNVVIPRMANIDNPGLSEAFVVQDIAINQEDSGEVNSPKRKRWKRLVRGRASSSEDTSMGDPLGKRMLFFEDDQGQEGKKIRLGKS
ncbi:hypothetical protein ACOSQ4_003311 [Xanthoceras sorbifolium]